MSKVLDGITLSENDLYTAASKYPIQFHMSGTQVWVTGPWTTRLDTGPVVSVSVVADFVFRRHLYHGSPILVPVMSQSSPGRIEFHYTDEGKAWKRALEAYQGRIGRHYSNRWLRKRRARG